MFHRFTVAFGVVAALLIAAPAFASDEVYPGGGTLAQIVDGGGTYSIITLINLDTVAANYNLYFYADNGSALTLTTTAGTASVLSGQLPVGGSTIIRTNGGASTIAQGYAVLVTNNTVAGSAVFGLPLASSPLAEASCPLDTGFDYIIGIPFDSTTAAVGLALANSIGDGLYQEDGPQTANLAIAFYDQSGNNFYSTTYTLPYGQHTAFMLNNQFPQVSGMTGTMVIVSRDPTGNPYAVKTLGLRANNAGTTFTSITPLVPCNGGYDSAGYYVCGN